MLTILLSTFFFLGILQSGSTCSTASVTTASGSHAPRGKICPGQLIFIDEFDELDTGKWKHENTLGGGGNWEFQWYTNNRENSFTRDGRLHIRPTLLADERGERFLHSGELDLHGECTNGDWYGCKRVGNEQHILNPIKSARISLIDSFSFKYGTVEVRAKLPSGDWLWPAIWMLPRHNHYSVWPASGEINIMESRGNRHLVKGGENVGTERIGSTLHWGPDTSRNKFLLTHFTRNNGAGYDNDFHVYKMIWTPDEITFYVDDDRVGTVRPPGGGFWELGGFGSSGLNNPWSNGNKIAPFDQEFYLILNTAVGGVNGYFSDHDGNPGGKPWSNTSPRAARDFWEGKNQWLPTWRTSTEDSHFQVDYVKVWAL